MNLRQLLAMTGGLFFIAAGAAANDTSEETLGAQTDVPMLVLRARSQYLAGETEAARVTFREVQKRDPENSTARQFLQRIDHDRARTTEGMSDEVDRAWARPITGNQQNEKSARADRSPLEATLDAIEIPVVSFSGMPLSRVVDALNAMAEEPAVTENQTSRSINLVLIDPEKSDPVIDLTMRHLSLRRILDLVTETCGYQYEVEQDAVIIRPPGSRPALGTEFFAVSRATVLRMTGKIVVKDGTGEQTASAGSDADTLAIRGFLERAGVSFDTVTGSALAFDGSQLIVTQSRRNLGRVRAILDRYRHVRQVEIEAKFMEVQQGALEELGVQWNLATKAAQLGGTQSEYTSAGGVTRTLADAFRNATSSQQITISGEGQPGGGLSLPASAPSIPGGVLLAASAAPLAKITGIIGEFDVSAMVRALSQKSGTELLSAPKLTVLSGNAATITVAQELRYPQSYGQIQSQVGTGSLSGGGSAGVSITSGTPQDFATRNIGVELRVLPTVEEDDRSVSLELNPKVTEFEGFVEYGGPSVAISGGTTVTVPPGFYQPIFAVREVSTKVTIWDGATLIMGGLTREDVKKVNDKVPVLGNLPGVGRLFRSKGESTQKRNLLIFVTARLINPGGALKSHDGGETQPSAVYENPVVVTPSGTRARPR